MEGGREQRDPGYDDWFDEPEPPTETQGDARASYDAGDEVWVLPEDEEPRLTGRREIVVAGRTLTLAQVAIIAGSFIVLLIAILAAAGAFSSSKAAAPTVSTPTTPPPQPTTAATTATTPTTQAPQQTLSPGATGSEVKTLQQALKSLGYDPGTPDGNYGPSTEAAVKAFQTANGLAADGVVGPETLQKLQQALSG